MSWGIKWQINFVSRKSRSYTLNILVDSYEGDVIPLRGAPSPFETTENNSEDYFAPIRTQTGYIRIIDNGYDLNGDAFDWTELIPSNNTEHQVRLIYGGDILWIGYMKADMFTTKAFDYGNEYEFPVICPLSLLGSSQITFTSSQGSMLTIGQILYTALSSTGIDWEYVDVSSNVENLADLNARISMMNYCDADPSVNSVTEVATWETTDSWSKVVESICMFWGWSIYTRGVNIYIVARGEDDNYRRFYFSQLSSTISAVESTYAADSVGIGDLTYISTEHYEDYLLGRRNIIIDANVNEWDNVLAPAFDELDYTWYGGTGHILTYGDYSSIQFFLTDTSTHTEYLHNYRLVFNPAYLEDDANILLSEDDNWKTDSEKNSFSLRNNIQCLTGGTLPDSILEQRVLGMKTLYCVSAPNNSMISISATARASLNPNDSSSFNPSTDYVRMYVKIGDYYWDGSSWSTTPAALEVYVNANGQINTTKTLFNDHYGAEGYCIEMSQSLFGQLEVAILMQPSRDILLDAFTVRIVPEDDMVFPTAQSTRTYKGMANATFADDLNVSLDIISGNNNKYGKAQLYKNDGSYFTTATFGESTVLPENHLLSRMTAAYGQIRNRLHLVVDYDDEASLPTTAYTHWDDATRTYHLQSVDHDWQNDEMKLTIVEF